MHLLLRYSTEHHSVIPWEKKSFWQLASGRNEIIGAKTFEVYKKFFLLESSHKVLYWYFYILSFYIGVGNDCTA